MRLQSKLIHSDFFSSDYESFLLNLGVDLILTDPPYGIADRGKVTKAHGKLYSNAEAWGDVFKDKFTDQEYDDFIIEFLDYAYRILKERGSLVTFIDDKYAGRLIMWAEGRGFVHKKNLHFVKVNCVPKIRKSNYASAAEVAVWLLKPAEKGASKTAPAIFNYQKPKKGLRHPDGELDIRRYHNTYSSNVFFYNIGKKVFGHPTEKYEAMWSPLVEHHSNPDSIVLDPFAGSFSLALVCRKLRRHFVGMDIDGRGIDAAKAKIRELEEQGYDADQD